MGGSGKGVVVAFTVFVAASGKGGVGSSSIFEKVSIVEKVLNFVVVCIFLYGASVSPSYVR
jgi:hypothetical protein